MNLSYSRANEYFCIYEYYGLFFLVRYTLHFITIEFISHFFYPTKKGNLLRDYL